MVKTVLTRRAAALARTAVDDADAARAELAQTHIASLLPALSRMQRLWAFAFIGIAGLAAASARVLGPFLPAPPMSVRSAIGRTRWARGPHTLRRKQNR